MRIAIHTQHFVGVGHHVRAARLARAFRQVHGSPHDVLVFDGGRPFSKAGVDLPGAADGRVQLPPLVRGKAGLDTLSPDQLLVAVLAERRQMLVDGLRRLQPDLFMIESFPFSRWALREEIFAGIRQAHASNSAVRVVCSLRDVPRASQERDGSHPHGWDSERGRPWPSRPIDDRLEQLPDILNAWFHAIVIHGDPRVTRLEDHFPWVPRLRIPVHYTGYVQQEPVVGTAASEPPAVGPLIVVSVGGGVNGLRLIELATAAFSELRRQPGRLDGRMVVFGGAFMSERESAAAAAACHQHGAQFKAFSSEFSAWLQAADLSISRGGYNTVVALLAARVRALVFPATDVSDQAFRIHRLAEPGIVITSPEGELDAGRLAALISATLDRPPPAHDLDLAGAERTVQLLTELVAERPAAGRVLAES
ncbi:MAG: glycosyltransferase [Gammaproteobacteria bacterium]|nr:glycosyltransferase [Gammaproteobacteria bacterium]